MFKVSDERMRRCESTDESDPLAAIHEIAKDMHAAGGITKRTMREYEELCVPAVPKHTKTAIIRIRQSAHVSQGVLAAYLNTSPSTVQKWEAGTKKPSGAAAKLLQIIEKHGLAVLA
ncbi:helix-turn-helix domain-containing protein [Pandoraea capi]|nr:DNA-binding transcriptional regulator [Pandoraea capi]